MPHNLMLSLEKSRVRSVHFELKGDVAGPQISVPIQISYRYDYKPRQKKIVSLLIVDISGEKVPFQMRVEFEGIFALNKSASRKRVETLANINCPAILFPFLRECIADITRRADMNSLLLPAVNFVELAKQPDTPKEA